MRFTKCLILTLALFKWVCFWMYTSFISSFFSLYSSFFSNDFDGFVLLWNYDLWTVSGCIYECVWLGRRDANLNELILVRIFYAKPDHFLYRQYIAKNWFELLSKCISIAYQRMCLCVCVLRWTSTSTKETMVKIDLNISLVCKWN